MRWEYVEGKQTYCRIRTSTEAHRHVNIEHEHIGSYSITYRPPHHGRIGITQQIHQPSQSRPSTPSSVLLCVALIVRYRREVPKRC